MIEGVVLAGFAGWRLASLLVREDGPFAVFERLRHLVGVRTGVLNPVAEVFTCVWCMSVWTCGAMMLLWLVAPAAVAVVAAMGFGLLVHGLIRTQPQ